jgi:hypothetical protein
MKDRIRLLSQKLIEVKEGSEEFKSAVAELRAAVREQTKAHAK